MRAYVGNIDALRGHAARQPLLSVWPSLAHHSSLLRPWTSNSKKGDNMKATRLKRSGHALLLALLLGAGCAYAANEWHDEVAVSRIYSHGEGKVLFSFVPSAPNCPNTNSPKWHTVEVGENGMTAEGLKLIYAGALTATALGRNVRVHYDNASANCFVARLIVCPASGSC